MTLVLQQPTHPNNHFHLFQFFYLLRETSFIMTRGGG